MRSTGGERITIARRGVPVVMLVPVEADEQRLCHNKIVEGMRELRKTRKTRHNERPRNDPPTSPFLTHVVIDVTEALA